MKVLLLAGGGSAERDVSLHSGEGVFEALSQLGHEVLAIDPESGQSLLDSHGRYNLTSNSPTVITESVSLVQYLRNDKFSDVEVVFNALHGGAGENGMIQCLLDLAGMRYTGSGRAASTIAMDKAVTKRLVLTEGIITPKWHLYHIHKQPIDDAVLSEILDSFSLPIIVKPNDSGSTIGLTVVRKEDQLKSALDAAVKESTQVLVEKYIPGRELTVAVLDGEALPVVEIIPKSGLYDYEAKYTKGKSEYIVPADIPPELASRLQESALTAYKIIGASGLARVDFIVDVKSQAYFLELNTLPGMTALSLAPMAAKAVGIDFNQLIQRLLESASKD